MNVEEVAEAKADFAKGWAWAEYDPSKSSPEKLVDAINENTAFEAKLPEKTEKKKNEVSKKPSFRIDPISCC